MLQNIMESKNSQQAVSSLASTNANAAIQQKNYRLIPSLIVLLLALVLLCYVGFGEAYRGYPILQMDKLIAQGTILQSSIESSLRAGLHLKYLPGLISMTEGMLESDSSIRKSVF